MIRILALVLCLLPISANAAIYNFIGQGTTFTGTESISNKALLSFEIDESDFGSRISLDQSNNGVFKLIFDGTIDQTSVRWNDFNVPPGIGCLWECAYAETDLNGTLVDFTWLAFEMPGSYSANLAGFETRDTRIGNLYSSGKWTISPVPLPAALPLFGAGLLAFAAIRKFRVIGRS
ncbi:hypothetical protein J0X12_15040 [Sneathiella sp. CAU 1612]|uniref:VPLPA-CTERM sorting domain-containing protein n=1 Tax=Sneathiella sedimenti TaxID=2816034 RepID=A0ABS3F8U3_9PROT|nr:VPLPA-CTERM sorting domain-containing protein [Sneathiella sedimenti]MBO0334940.1 hypothetical protein [Sneathiella sedimenti]